MEAEKNSHEEQIGKKTVGEFIYDSILSNPETCVIREIATIDRKFYRDEAERILRKQAEFITELNDRELFEKCVRELYKNNVAHANLRLANKSGLIGFILDDVLFYQRPLKSKKSEIDVCELETCNFPVKNENGEERKKYKLRCTSRSNPLFAEFRILQFIANLRLKDEDANDSDVTKIINKEELFAWLNEKASVDQREFLRKLPNLITPETEYGRVHWNYLTSDKKYPCNPVRAEILKRFKKCKIKADLSKRVVRGGNATAESAEHALWHLLYSVVEREELRKALTKFSALKVVKNDSENADDFEDLIPAESRENFVAEFLKIKRLETLQFVGSGYASYSERALRKLLPLMRFGKNWNFDAIDESTRKRIEGFIAGTQEFDKNILLRAKENGFDFEKKESAEESRKKFSGLPVWLASYIVYGRHAEASEEALKTWKSPDDITHFLAKEFRHNSLRNPTAEKVILETLRVVRDIWKSVGNIDEIHIELGREIRQPKEQRRRATLDILRNENANIEIRRELQRLADSGRTDVHPGSPAHIDKYKLWQECPFSPYTGRGINIADLFSEKYEIEHVIPRAQFFDNSFSNKVLCEASVNLAKGNRLAMQFINQTNGGNAGGFEIMPPGNYETFVNQHYSGKKKELLLATEIPTGFANSQLAGTQYIAKYVRNLLSRVVRKTDEHGNALDSDKGVVAAGIISCTGTMTDSLKKSWGMNDVWNEITLPRFAKMCALTGENGYVVKNTNGELTGTVPLAMLRGFKKKRIDHRHHAMDAIVIACCTREHVRMMSNESAGTAKFTDFRNRLRENGNFKKPWSTFTEDVRAALEKMIPTFKKNVRAMSKGRNVYSKIDPKTGKRFPAVQEKGDIRKIRKPLHKETFYGKTNLLRKGEISLRDLLKDLLKEKPVYPSRICDKKLRAELRKKLDELATEQNPRTQIEAWLRDNGNSFQGVRNNRISVWKYSEETLGEEMVAARKDLAGVVCKRNVDKITDESIRKTLENFIASKGLGENATLSAEDIAEMNREIEKYTPNKKSHKPIWRARFCDSLGEKYPVGKNGNKGAKFVEAQKGTNLYFAVYLRPDGRREFETVPLRTVLANLREGEPPVPQTNANRNKLLFCISPGDIVYLPKPDEEIDEKSGKQIEYTSENIDRSRLFKLVKATTVRAFFVPVCISRVITDREELGVANCIELHDGISIRTNCLPVKLDRLGNILKIGTQRD